MKFKLNDRVRVKDSDWPYPGAEGVVIRVVVEETFPYKVSFDGISWYIYSDEELEPVEKTLFNLVEGDVVVNKHGEERTILGVAGKVYFLSGANDQEGFWGTYTAKQLKEDGYKVKGVEEDKTETIRIEDKDYTVSEVKEALKKYGKGKK